MHSKKTNKFEAVVITLFLIGTMISIPAISMETKKVNNSIEEEISYYEDFYGNKLDLSDPFLLDRNYYLREPESASTNSEDYDDAGYRQDSGDKWNRADNLYPGEMVEDSPGRSRTGKLSENDDEDWYVFSGCEGQDIHMTMTPPSGFDFDLYLYDEDEEKASSMNSGSVTESITYTLDKTGEWIMAIIYVDGSGEGQYTFDVDLTSQNDIGTGNDAGDTFDDATMITPGVYSGYVDMNDEFDWYKFNANEGDGIHFILEMKWTALLSDFDLYLYNPSGELVLEEDHYYNDEFNFLADVSGQWRVKVDIYPGYTDIPQPTEWEYYTYGSGAYNLEFSIESTGSGPIDPIPQPQIIPIAKTFNIANDPNSNDDEFGYIASIPACNYLEGGERYLAPIFYEGDETLTNWFDTDEYRGDVDDTTQYVIDDWNDYLSLNGKTAVEYNVPADPIQAAAEIATNNWVSSDLAVVVVDGSEFEDNVEEVIKETKTLTHETQVEIVSSSDDSFEGVFGGKPLLIGPKWGAISIEVFDIALSSGDPNCAFLTEVYPYFINLAGDWWPVAYDGPGDSVDIYNPIPSPGIYTVGSDVGTSLWSEMHITKFAGDRYKIKVDDPDSAIFVKVETDTPSDVLVFLLDPDGHLRAPDIPQWNGPVNPIHVWNGFENPVDNPWRTWDPEMHTEFSAEVLHPEVGDWTAIVVPRYPDGGSIEYTITGELKTTNDDRADAIVSATNGAVIASFEHAPLLYVTEDSIPSETSSALTSLGVDKVIFVERGGIGNAVKDELPTIEADLTTMEEIVNYIKNYQNSENYITITSTKSGDGYFAPAAMIAAYHGSPVFRVGEMEGNPAGLADRIQTWRLWAGDYYHGSRSPSHLPIHDEPVPGGGYWSTELLIDAFIYAITGGDSGYLPPIGMDAKRYWNEELIGKIYDFTDSYGLNKNGQEAYCIVAPRKDIDITFHAILHGNNSYGGQMVGITPAYTNAMVIRNILYPALIFANPNRDVTTTQAICYPDGSSWTTNDGQGHSVFSTRLGKHTFGSHFRDYEGHCLWEAHLQRMNEGASVLYYSGHGTGGSGVSAQYYQTEHCNYPEQIWWDAWRGYRFDSWKMPRDNGFTWYNAEPPMLYDLIHYDYNDELFDNLRSNSIFYMSCSTGDAFGPMAYLDHGAVCWYGNAGSGLCPEADLQDDEFFKDLLLYGESLGKAYSHQVWLHYRDLTTSDPTSMYGPCSMYDISTVQMIYGDPELIIYSPEWTMPEPIDA